MTSAPHSSPPTRDAFSLVEVMIALGIVTFGIVTIFALLPTGLQLVRESTDESVASGILTMVGSDLQAQTTSPSETPRFKIPLTAGTKAGILQSPSSGGLLFDISGRYLGTNATNSQARFLASYSVRASTANQPANAVVLVSWPAQAATPAGKIETLVALPSSP